MTTEDFRKLNRAGLLEILLAQAEEIERLQQQCDELKKQLSDRRILIEQAGSIAEASLKLNAVFEAAQAAADEYLNNVRLQSEQLMHDDARQHQEQTTRRRAQAIAECDEIIRDVQLKKKLEKKPFRLDEFI